jgi:hypothetical protein
MCGNVVLEAMGMLYWKPWECKSESYGNVVLTAMSTKSLQNSVLNLVRTTAPICGV